MASFPEAIGVCHRAEVNGVCGLFGDRWGLAGRGRVTPRRTPAFSVLQTCWWVCSCVLTELTVPASLCLAVCQQDESHLGTNRNALLFSMAAVAYCGYVKQPVELFSCSWCFSRLVEVGGRC